LEGADDNLEAVMPHMRALDNVGLEAGICAACACPTADPESREQSIACVRSCVGGRVSFLTNAVLPIKAAISFYVGGIAPNPDAPKPLSSGLLGRAGDLHAPQLLFRGGLDKHLGPEQTRAVVESLRGASKSFVNVDFPHADNGFFRDARRSHHAESAKQAWRLTLTFLNCHLGN
jgi:carboxymethylenebutenolidase